NGAPARRARRRQPTAGVLQRPEPGASDGQSADGPRVLPRVQPSGTADVSIRPLISALQNAPSLRVALGRSWFLLDLSPTRWQDVASELRRRGTLDGGG